MHEEEMLPVIRLKAEMFLPNDNISAEDVFVSLMAAVKEFFPNLESVEKGGDGTTISFGMCLFAEVEHG